jgi:hypothetical protein
MEAPRHIVHLKPALPSATLAAGNERCRYHNLVATTFKALINEG